jgi:LysM repeat protein
METVAHSDDLGINYGAVRWSFRYVGPGMRPLYTQEKSQISAAASSDVKESLIAFNKYYMNKHIVQEGETLKSISIDYYGDDSQVASIFAINKQAVTDANPEARIPVGTELEMTGRKWEQVKSIPKQNMWERAKNTGHGAEQ